jgi:hypothetical protein
VETLKLTVNVEFKLTFSDDYVLVNYFWNQPVLLTELYVSIKEFQILTLSR